MLIQSTFLRKKLRSFAWHLFNHLENNNNTNFHTNGEGKFIDSLFEYYQKSEGLVFFDVGANIGAYTQMLLHKSALTGVEPIIHAFEPTEACFRLLDEKFSHNNGVRLNKKGLSDKKETVQIFYDKHTSGLASLYKRQSIKMDQSEMVELIRLENYISHNDISHIHLLKVDVEGHEMSVFKGMADFLSGEFVDFIQFEYGGANLDSHTSLIDLYTLFEKSGFYVAKVMRGGLKGRPYQSFMENFQYSNYVAVSKYIANKL